MGDRRKLVFAAILFTFLYNTLDAKKSHPILDMAPDAVDDLYNNCQEEAMKLVTSGLLEKEQNSKGIFETAWSRNAKCLQQTSADIKTHAVSAYINGDRLFKKAFNKEVATMGVNGVTYKNFQFKSLHFLLMNSMVQQPHKCKFLYLMDPPFTAKVGSKVRLGRFMEAVGDIKTFGDLDSSVIVNITSCFYINLKENSCTNNAEADFLLSPAEVFTVESVNQIINGVEYTEIVLKHSLLKSFHDCYISRSPADMSNQWLVLWCLQFYLFSS
ncbi:ecto-ADP-ribosyltransferase 5 [Echeneis naucrates]|uniref:ecto-ADP-ribosyltransferase 5 n=1 Tax=Echeneis naucrates TaxID=173247 RepID=UPI0011142CD7|nr:ecto-ADP-ribosyltransferase 5-like [Echeneis naucrates]XP_029365362.1 ecto-ADP-ribosyltransferase 5-like [Echeneis naucrates]XP_029365369.1 ecto-ADP-ribosyltransferase 5-like [Echeneis naucrates]XP_029365379.1 ecto-ADP-ribosyltransferase 5-like [Echeneis naucrates]